jgi:hypothetical protein
MLNVLKLLVATRTVTFSTKNSLFFRQFVYAIPCISYIKQLVFQYPAFIHWYFLTVAHCIPCEVRNGPLYVVRKYVETQCPSLAKPCKICAGQSGTRTRFFRVLQFSFVRIILPLLHTYLLYTCTALIWNTSRQRRLKKVMKPTFIMVWDP